MWHTVVDQDLFMKLLCVLVSRALLKSSIFMLKQSPLNNFFLKLNAENRFTSAASVIHPTTLSQAACFNLAVSYTHYAWGEG